MEFDTHGAFRRVTQRCKLTSGGYCIIQLSICTTAELMRFTVQRPPIENHRATPLRSVVDASNSQMPSCSGDLTALRRIKASVGPILSADEQSSLMARSSGVDEESNKIANGHLDDQVRKKLTGQFADKPTRDQSSRGLVNSPTASVFKPCTDCNIFVL